MLNYEFTKQNPEISRLIEYGYDLHKREMSHQTYGVPNFEFYNGNSCPMKKIGDNGIFGNRAYPNHSQSYICTTLGICVGKKKKKSYELKTAYMLQTNNDDYSIYFSKLKIKEDDKWYETLDYDHDNSLDNLTHEEKLEHFIYVMEFVGFKREDIIAVINKKMTAREAYQNVAPEDIKNISWVNKRRRIFEFENNIGISGNYSSLGMDDFPFPFDEQPILDCSKVKINCIYFENNKRKIKLININENKDSITHTDLKNAIIDEPIDLSRVDATGTKFGHHTVINVDYSLGKINTMDLTLAVNENGERYDIDENGNIKYDEEFYPKTIPNQISQNILVMANGDNEVMVKEAIQNDADGIGLIRTENILSSYEDITNVIDLLINFPNKEEKEKIFSRIKELQKQQLREILKNIDKQIIIRLMDFKLKEYMILTATQCDDEEENIDYIRGANVLDDNETILKAQLEAIFEELEGKDIEINLLIPMIMRPYEYNRLKIKIDAMAEKYNIKSLKIGAMIENEEIAKEADTIAASADFIAIGTSDLTESITKIPRQNNTIEYQELDENVKETIKEIIFKAKAINPDIKIGICGEHSNYIENVAFYASLCIDYISCDSHFIKVNKDIINTIKSNQDIPIQFKKKI